MNKGRLIVFLVSFLLVVSALSLPVDSVQDQVLGARTGGVGDRVFSWVRRLTWKKHKNSEYGYSISYPRNFKIEERNTETSRSFKISGVDDEAYVVIGAFKDESLKEEGGLSKMIAEKEMELKSDPDYLIGGFASMVEGPRSGYMATGGVRTSGKEMRFLEKGLYGNDGKVLLMQAAAVPEKFEEYEIILTGVMDSFKVW
jgi:hypothetical protein